MPSVKTTALPMPLDQFATASCSRRLVDQALDDLVAADLVAAAETARSPAFGVSHTGSDPRTTATSSLM